MFGRCFLQVTPVTTVSICIFRGWVIMCLLFDRNCVSFSSQARAQFHSLTMLKQGGDLQRTTDEIVPLHEILTCTLR